MNKTQSPQKDRFVHDRLPGKEAEPQIIPLANIPSSGPLNCTSFLIDRHLQTSSAERTAIRSSEREWSYRELSAHVNRIANVLKQDYQIEPGNRVLIRGANSPEAAAVWLAIQKIGAIAVTTMPLLRAGELTTLIALSKPQLAVCDAQIAAELSEAIDASGGTTAMITYEANGGALYRAMEGKSDECDTCPTLADDISIIGFTSGTTGKPKATVHFHRDILAICETMCRHIIRPVQQDVFIGTAPLAFTFGLGGLLVFPFYFGACTVLNSRYTPQQLAQAIEHYQASICFTVPTFYQQMLRLDDVSALSGLRIAISSGEALPQPVRQLWQSRTGVELAEVLGSTEMLHAFAGASGSAIKSGYIGPAIPGFELAILDEKGNPLAVGEIGRLAVKGPTGCRYLDDPRQAGYVQNGWNITGDACVMDADGYVAYHTRYDDMIISAGYNISGLEIENALLAHSMVAECAVIGEADTERGQIVAAFIVLKQIDKKSDDLIRELREFVKQKIAPYKYPRRIEFVQKLPRNESGKLQRFRLRN